MRPAALAALALLVAAAAGAAAQTAAPIQASTYRVDLGQLAPGETREGELQVYNRGYDPILIRLEHEGDPVLVETPDTLVVRPGEPATLPYRLTIPADGAPGFHGESLRLVTTLTEGAQGAGTINAGPAIVFTARTVAVGVATIEAPRIALPEDAVEGHVSIVSTWNESVNVTATLEWRAADGSLLASTELGPAPLAPQETARLPYAFPAAGAAPGPQTLVGRVVAADGAPLAGAMSHTFHVGVRAATYAVADITDLRDGNASFRLVYENVGDVPVTLTPRLVLLDATGAERLVALDPVTLQPGERRELVVNLPLPPGRWSARLEADGAGSPLEQASLAAPVEFRVRDPEVLRDASTALRLAAALGVLALVALAGLLAWRRRGALAPRLAVALRRLPRPRLPRLALPRRRPDPYADLFERLEHAPPPPPAATRAALLLDLDSLGAQAGDLAQLTTFCAGWDVVAAYAYARAPDAAGAAALAAQLEAAGYTPRVRVGVPDLHVELTLDALREAGAGRAILLASRDPAYAALERAVEAAGLPVTRLERARRLEVREAGDTLKSRHDERPSWT